jgi:5-methylcytosine-specific restriction endonuclease McrA
VKHDNDNSLPRTRVEAKIMGVRTYFSGKSCPHGHIAERWADNSTCVICDRERKNARYRKDPQAVLEQQRKYQLADIDKHRKNERERSAKRRREKPDEVRAYAREWNRKNKDDINRKVRDRRKLNPEPHMVSVRNRRARIKGSGGRHTAADISEILQRQKFKCAECGASVRRRENRHVDHIMPIALGGANDKSNLQILCPPCNLSKNAKHPLDFAQERGRLV